MVYAVNVAIFIRNLVGASIHGIGCRKGENYLRAWAKFVCISVTLSRVSG
jgi:hypothetical protein